MQHVRVYSVPVGVCALAACVFTIGMNAPLLDPQEARYAEVAREMQQRREPIIPLLRGQPYLDKPPLLYWLMIAATVLLGEGDGPVRLVPAAAAVLTVFVTFLWCNCRVGRKAGLLAGGMLTLTPF